MEKENVSKRKMLSLFNVCDLLLLPIFISFCLIGKKGYGLFFCVLGLFLFLFGFQSNRKVKVINKSDSVLWAKPEEGDEPHTIQINETCEGVDGVKLGERVFKLPNGLPVVVKNDGLHHFSLTGWLCYHVFGREYTNWKKLFDVK